MSCFRDGEFSYFVCISKKIASINKSRILVINISIQYCFIIFSGMILGSICSISALSLPAQKDADDFKKIYFVDGWSVTEMKGKIAKIDEEKNSFILEYRPENSKIIAKRRSGSGTSGAFLNIFRVKERNNTPGFVFPVGMKYFNRVAYGRCRGREIEKFNNGLKPVVSRESSSKLLGLSLNGDWMNRWFENERLKNGVDLAIVEGKVCGGIRIGGDSCLIKGCAVH